MASTIILSDNGASSGSAGVKTTGGNDGVLILQTTTSGGTATNAVYIDTSQNVGIGTTSPSARLHVTSSASGSYGAIIYNTSATGQGLTVRGGSTSSQDAFNVQTYDGGTSLFAIQGGGNVGIGTSSPSVNLEVKGSSAPNIKVSSDSNVYTYLTMNAWALDRAQLRAEATNPGAGSGTGSGILSFWTAGNPTMTERMRIDASGNLLVGKTTSSATAATGLLVNSDGTIYSTLSASTAGTNTNLVYSTGAAAYRFYVGMEGKVYCTSTTITGISDQRLKENIRDLDDGLEKVMALQPRKFDWKEGKGKGIANDRGFIAQEFAQVFPDMIDEWLDPAPEGEEPYKAVNANLVPTLVKAIQEQQAIITSLTERITALEAK